MQFFPMDKNGITFVISLDMWNEDWPEESYENALTERKSFDVIITFPIMFMNHRSRIDSVPDFSVGRPLVICF